MGPDSFLPRQQPRGSSTSPEQAPTTVVDRAVEAEIKAIVKASPPAKEKPKEKPTSTSFDEKAYQLGRPLPNFDAPRKASSSLLANRGDTDYERLAKLKSMARNV